MNGSLRVNILNALKSNIRLFEKAFSPSTILDWTQEEFVECLMQGYSEEESNKKETKVNTYKSFIDFVESVFQDGNNLILWLFLSSVLLLLVFA